MYVKPVYTAAHSTFTGSASNLQPKDPSVFLFSLVIGLKIIPKKLAEVFIQFALPFKDIYQKSNLAEGNPCVAPASR